MTPLCLRGLIYALSFGYVGAWLLVGMGVV